jgi:PAS domain S-box-containing protein
MARKVFSATNYCDHKTMNSSTDIQGADGAAKAPEDSRLPTEPVTAPESLSEALDLLEVESARRIRAEEALRDSEERFRQLSERAGKFLWISDPETNELVYVSPGFEEVWARTREGSYSSPEQWANSFKRPNRNITPGDVSAAHDHIYQVAGPDGSVRWIRDRMFSIRDATGNIRTLGIAEDVTDAKQLHDTVARNTAQTRSLLAIIPDLLFRVRKDGIIIEFHAGKDSQLVLPEANLVGKNLKHLLSTQLATQAMQHIAAALRTREVQTFTCEYLLPDEVRDFEARGIACADDEVIVLVRDITERKRLEREIVEATSREQQRIGQDLHDSLGQHLTGITFLTKVLERRLSTKSPEEAQEAAEIGRLVIQALAQTRNLARGLFPAELERNGLVAAIQELAGTVEQTCSVRCAVHADQAVTVNDNVLATHVFRIAQEAINNSIKHGKAKNIEVTLAPKGDKMELNVTDDGSGFSPAAKIDGLGLRIMHYRARRVGGVLEIAKTDKGGTRVSCLFRSNYESN